MLHKFENDSDMDVILRIKNGEEELYEILIKRYNSFLYKIGRAYRYNHEDTEDLMQETYISAFSNLSKFEHRASFKTWFTRIMLNQCYKKRHKLSFKNEIAMDEPQIEISKNIFQKFSTDKNTPINRELGHIIENAIHEIPEDYRIVFTLRELNGFSVLETAESLDISASNVKVRLNRAKTMLRSKIEQIYSPEEIFDFNKSKKS